MLGDGVGGQAGAAREQRGEVAVAEDLLAPRAHLGDPVRVQHEQIARGEPDLDVGEHRVEVGAQQRAELPGGLHGARAPQHERQRMAAARELHAQAVLPALEAAVRHGAEAAVVARVAERPVQQSEDRARARLVLGRGAQRVARERHIAQVLQRSLLPPGIPAVPGLPVAVRFIPAGEGIEVGGDFYDVFPARGDRVAAVIGDVCGKGPEAASVTALARHTLRAAAAYESRPSAVLGLLHRALRDAREDDRFCTVAFCDIHLDDEGARVVLACGGHPLPLVLRRSGAVEPAGKLGTLLGADLDPVLADVEVRLAPGDLLVLYTDGVTEVRAGRREIFGHGDLADLLARCAGEHPESVAERVQAAVLAAAGGRPRDDIAIVVLGPAPPPQAEVPGILPDADRPLEAPDGR